MNRWTTYAGVNPSAQDILWTGRYAMTALALLAQDLLGTNTVIFGAPCGPTSPASMSVLVGAGRIYSMAALEPSAWSSLAADPTLVLKQGILSAAGATLACPAPVTSGFSQNYLIEGQYQEIDTNNLTLSYWNAGNPQQPFSGAGNNGIAQPRIRSSQFILQVKAGVPATTGTQTTPSADSGWTPMYAVTVANGATTLTSGNISAAAGAPLAQGNQSGSFTLTATGFSGTAPAGTCFYRTSGPLVTLQLPVLTGTSNSGSFSLTGLPASLQPSAFDGSTNQTIPLALAENNSSFAAGGYAVIQSATGIINLGLLGVLAGWTASGTKSVAGNLSYLLY